MISMFALCQVNDNLLFDNYKLIFEYEEDVESKQEKICCEARVANIVSSLLFSDKICETKNVVHDEKSEGLVH